jgi:hypothetical protein
LPLIMSLGGARILGKSKAEYREVAMEIMIKLLLSN